MWAYYYDTSWRVLEEQYDAGPTDPTEVALEIKYQYVWDIRYIDAPICRDENKNGDSDCTDAATGVQGSNNGDEHLYYTNDANMNVTALVDVYDGAVVERYIYDAYGKVTVLHGVRDNDGTDTSGSEWSARAAADDFDNEILFCGYRYDPETGLYHVRNRYYHPTLGRWVSRDPIGYADGMSLYQYASSNVASFRDPWGYCTYTGYNTDKGRRIWQSCETGRCFWVGDDGTKINTPCPKSSTVTVKWDVAPMEVIEGETDLYTSSVQKVVTAYSAHSAGGAVTGTVEGEAGVFFASVKVGVEAEINYNFTWGKTRSLGLTRQVTKHLPGPNENNDDCEEKACWCVYQKSVTLSGHFAGRKFSEDFPTLEIQARRTADRIPNGEECPKCPRTPKEVQ